MAEEADEIAREPKLHVTVTDDHGMVVYKTWVTADASAWGPLTLYLGEEEPALTGALARVAGPRIGKVIMGPDPIALSRQRTDHELLETLNRKVDEMTAGLEGLQAKVDTLSTEDTELIQTVETVVGAFETVEKELEALRNSGETTDEELAPVTQAVSKASEAVSNAIAKLHAAEPPAEPSKPVTTDQAVYVFVGPGTPESPFSEAALVTAEAFKTPEGSILPEGSTLYTDANDTPGAQPPTEAGVGKPGWVIYKGAVRA